MMQCAYQIYNDIFCSVFVSDPVREPQHEKGNTESLMFSCSFPLALSDLLKVQMFHVTLRLQMC